MGVGDGRIGEEGLGGHPAQCSLTANPPPILVNDLKYFGNPCSSISGDLVESFPFFFFSLEAIPLLLPASTWLCSQKICLSGVLKRAKYLSSWKTRPEAASTPSWPAPPEPSGSLAQGQLVAKSCTQEAVGRRG